MVAQRGKMLGGESIGNWMAFSWCYQQLLQCTTILQQYLVEMLTSAGGRLHCCMTALGEQCLFTGLLLRLWGHFPVQPTVFGPTNATVIFKPKRFLSFHVIFTVNWLDQVPWLTRKVCLSNSCQAQKFWLIATTPGLLIVENDWKVNDTIVDF